MSSITLAATRIPLSEYDYLILAGPTAVGKTALVNELARKMALEVVSADSRQVYRGMDIGTATPDAETLARIPHHFINELEPDTVWNAGTFYKEARQRIRKICQRDRLPVVVGGAGLYLEALRQGFFDETAKDLAIRKRYEVRLHEIGAAALWQELKDLDPEYAATFHFNDHKKLVRAFEIYESSGKSPSKAFAASQDPFELHGGFLVLDRPRELLYQRIDDRVDQMMAAGLVDECQSLLRKGYGPELYPLRTIGYQEVFEHLAGRLSEDEATALIKKNTRNFAKRQLTWFRNHPFDHWITLDDEVHTG